MNRILWIVIFILILLIPLVNGQGARGGGGGSRGGGGGFRSGGYRSKTSFFTVL